MELPIISEYQRKQQATKLVTMYSSKKAQESYHNFLAGNIIRAFQKEGLFEFLNQPQSIEEIAEKFHYTDKELLKNVLQLLAEENILVSIPHENIATASTFHDGIRYQNAPETTDRWAKPLGLDEKFAEIWISYGNTFPNRLRGQYVEFTGELNLFKWDNALATKMYENFRQAAFTYSQALSRRGSFLDVGCGNAYGTSAIWTYYYNQGCYDTDKNLMQLHAIDINAHLLRIAQDEFSLMLASQLNISKDEIENFTHRYEKTFPKFQRASAMQLPFADNTFDVVYASLVLHWLNTEKGLHEMIRVAKPGGLIFGVETFHPKVDRFMDFHYIVNKDAQGCLTKEQFKRYALEAGAKKVSFATDFSIFKIEK